MHPGGTAVRAAAFCPGDVVLPKSLEGCAFPGELGAGRAPCDVLVLWRQEHTRPVGLTFWDGCLHDTRK